MAKENGNQIGKATWRFFSLFVSALTAAHSGGGFSDGWESLGGKVGGRINHADF